MVLTRQIRWHSAGDDAGAAACGGGGAGGGWAGAAEVAGLARCRGEPAAAFSFVSAMFFALVQIWMAILPKAFVMPSMALDMVWV